MSVRVRFVLMCVLSVTALRAQDATELLAGASSVYANAGGYSCEVAIRTLTAYGAPAQEGAEGASPVSTSYRRLVFRFAKPSDYFVGSHSFSERTSTSSPGQPPIGGGWSYLSKYGNRTPKSGASVNGQFAVRDVPDEQFYPLLAGRVASRGSTDPILRCFLPSNFGSASPMSGPAINLFEMTDARVVESDDADVNGVHVEGKLRTGATAHVWIQNGTYLVVRTVVRAEFRGPPGGYPGGYNPRIGGSVVETLYNNQRIDPKFTNADFAIPTTPNDDRPTGAQLGFGAVEDTLKLTGMTVETSAPGASGQSAVAQTPPAPAQPETQALSQEQMAAVVLIEGDQGSGTGFMTKIKDVDFVVTNLHVIGGNKKITIKTLRGEEVPMQGIFGAVGADIAIIRVAKSQGDLKLATDVFQSTKIGDKVVVVGNRRGGGVATQTTGAVKGVGPSLVEIDANFQPGNSGSPIVNLSTGEVVGIASYTESRRVEVDGAEGQPASSSGRGSATKVEKRWFGYRVDGVSKWEAVDLARLNDQSERIEKFKDMSEALVALLRGDLGGAQAHPRLAGIVGSFISRVNAAANNQIVQANEAKDLFRVVRTIADDGMKDLSSGSYYDYFRTCQYWDSSIPAQLEYRKEIIEVLKRYEVNSAGYVARLRGGR